MDIFPGGPGLSGAGMSPFWITLDDGGGGYNWSHKTCKVPVKSSPPTDQHPNFLQAGCPSCLQSTERRNCWDLTPVNADQWLVENSLLLSGDVAHCSVRLRLLQLLVVQRTVIDSRLPIQPPAANTVTAAVVVVLTDVALNGRRLTTDLQHAIHDLPPCAILNAIGFRFDGRSTACQTPTILLTYDLLDLKLNPNQVAFGSLRIPNLLIQHFGLVGTAKNIEKTHAVRQTNGQYLYHQNHWHLFIYLLFGIDCVRNNQMTTGQLRTRMAPVEHWIISTVH